MFSLTGASRCVYKKFRGIFPGFSSRVNLFRARSFMAWPLRARSSRHRVHAVACCTDLELFCQQIKKSKFSLFLRPNLSRHKMFWVLRVDKTNWFFFCPRRWLHLYSCCCQEHSRANWYQGLLLNQALSFIPVSRAVARPWRERRLPRAPIFTERKNCQIFNFKTH